ncbi:MAG: hypothetical protein GEU92_19505 [Alphaproteobacteria bacterium]|nr:hypothetical protein [Alphaproteobacteria bacterium]
MTFRRQGGRKTIVAPDEAMPWAAAPPKPDDTIIRALARAHRWRRMLEHGKYATLGEISKAEKVNASYLSRVMRLSLLAPDVVEAILDGRLREGIQLTDLLEPLPMGWEEQRERLLRPDDHPVVPTR